LWVFLFYAFGNPDTLEYKLGEFTSKASAIPNNNYHGFSIENPGLGEEVLPKTFTFPLENRASYYIYGERILIQ
jgi:hypothetical protein